MKNISALFLILILFACSGNHQKKQNSSVKKDTIGTNEDLLLADTLSVEDKEQMDSLLKNWTVFDSLDLTEQDYRILWEDLIVADTGAVLCWMKQNINKLVNTDGYFVLRQVVFYNDMRIGLEKAHLFAADSLVSKAEEAIESIEEELIGRKIVYRCILQNPTPVCGPYFFLEDHTVRSYTAFLMAGNINVGTWKKQDGKMILTFGDKKQIFRETDSIFIAETPKMRNLIKLGPEQLIMY